MHTRIRMDGLAGRVIDQMKELGVKPRFHGNGFTQAQLNGTQRLHVFDPNLPPIPDHNATIHDHVFEMESRILLGVVEHVIYGRWHSGPPQFFDTYRVDRATDTLVREGGKSAYGVIGWHKMSAGSSYFFGAGHMHETKAGGYAATLMTKIPVPGADLDNKEPFVLCPVGEVPVDAFDPKWQPEQDEMWSAIYRVLRMLTPTGMGLIDTALKNRQA